MIEVELPDGRILEFPEGTSQDEMRAAIAKFLGPKPIAEVAPEDFFANQQARYEEATSRPPRTLADAARDNIFGVDDGVMSPGEKLATAINLGAEGLSFGVVGDEANAAFDSMIGREGPSGLDGYRANEDQFRAENPFLAAASEFVPSMAAPGGAIKSGAGLLSKMGRGAAVSGAGAATYGFMEGEGGLDDRVDNATSTGILGAMLGGAVPVAGAGIAKAADGIMQSRAMRRVIENAPSSEDLIARARALYRDVNDAGVQVKPEAFDRLRGNMADAATSVGFDNLPGPGSLTPMSARVAQIGDEMSAQMAAEPTAALPFESLDRFRRQMGAAAGNMNQRQDSKVGMTMIEEVDRFVNELSEADVTTGDIAALQTAIPKARETFSQAMRSQMIDDAVEQAENYVSGPASGLRNQFGRILRSPKLSRAFNEAELKALRRVVNGSYPERLIHLLGGGLGQIGSTIAGSAVGAGGGIAGILAGGAAGAGASGILRHFSENIAAKNAEAARALVATPRASQNLPVVSDRARGLLDDILLRSARAGAMATQ